MTPFPDLARVLGQGARPPWLPDDLAVEVIPPPAPPSVADLFGALAEALAHPVGSRPLREVVTARTRAVVIVPRAAGAVGGGEPTAALFRAVRRELGVLQDDQITLALAGGDDGPGASAAPGLPGEVLARHRLVAHDSRDPAAVVEMGRTSRGTRLRIARCVAEADVVVTIGRISPHPFAGYGGGGMGIYPGLGYEEDVRQHRLLEADPASRLGRSDLNPWREDVEEAVRRLGRDTFMLDVVAAGGAILGAVAGDIVLAHREGARRLEPWVEVAAAPAEVVVVSAPLPVAGDLRRASRLIAPAGLLLRDGGVVVLAAECPFGVGPAEPEGERLLLRPGLRRYLPARFTLLLVSTLDQAAATGCGATWAPSLEAALAEARRLAGPWARLVVVPDASDLVPVADLPGSR